MRTLFRKLRGLVGVGLTWGILWATVMAGVGMIIWIVDPGSMDPGEGPLVAGAIVGFQGLVAGVGFGLLLSFAETRKKILDLSPVRAGIYGLVASAALPFVTGMPLGMVWLVCLLGAASASASVTIARRAELRDPEQRKLLNSESHPI